MRLHSAMSFANGYYSSHGTYNSTVLQADTHRGHSRKSPPPKERHQPPQVQRNRKSPPATLFATTASSGSDTNDNFFQCCYFSIMLCSIPICAFKLYKYNKWNCFCVRFDRLYFSKLSQIPVIALIQPLPTRQTMTPTTKP